jgi:hypothetical protein
MEKIAALDDGKGFFGKHSLHPYAKAVLSLSFLFLDFAIHVYLADEFAALAKAAELPHPEPVTCAKQNSMFNRYVDILAYDRK